MTNSSTNTQILHEQTQVESTDASSVSAMVAARETSGKRRAREQLESQAPGPQVGIDEAREYVASAVRTAVNGDGVQIVQVPAGVGKSYATAAVCAEQARSNLSIAYVAPNHAVAAQTLDLLPADVRERTVHVHSPLVQVGNGPVCARADELTDLVFKLGANQHQICRMCPKREGCEAKKAHDQRDERKKNALVLFTSHAGVEQAFDESVQERVIVVDEMPAVFETVSVTRAQLESLAGGGWMLGVLDAPQRETLARTAQLWLGDAAVDVADLGLKVESLQGRLRLDLRPGVVPSEQQMALLKAARAVIRLASTQLMRVADASGVEAIIHTDAYRALTDGYGARVLLSATPMLAAFPKATVHACEVRDACPWHERTMRYRADRGKQKLEDRLQDGSLWRDLRLYVDHLREAAGGGRILLVTFKSIADALRDEPERVGGVENIDVAHYGATLGLNDWQEDEHGNQRVRVFATFGDPWLASIGTLQALGVAESESFDEARKIAAGELYQAHERARAVSARWPVQFFHEGAVAPAGWHPGNATMETLQDASQAATDAFLEELLRGRSYADIAAACGVTTAAVKMWARRGAAPAEHELALRRLRPRLRLPLAPTRIRVNAGSYRVRQRLERQAAERRAAHQARCAQRPDSWEEVYETFCAHTLARVEYLDALAGA
jgi:hypothetical protein